MSKYMDLLQTDPLAQGAVAGFVVLLVVSVGVFVFLLKQRDVPKP